MTQLTSSAADLLTARRRRTIFFVTALGAFMGSLDLSIVNVAFPALERAFSARLAGHALLGAYWVRDCLRVSARGRGPHRRPTR